MNKNKIFSFGFLGLVLLLVVGVSSVANSSPVFEEHRPEGLMLTEWGELPHYDDHEETPNGPLPSSPEIIPWSKVVFQRYGNGNYDIYVGNDDGTGQQQLTNTAANDLYPNFNRGATRIVFASDREPSTGDYDLYTMNANGSNVTQITFTTGDDWNAEFSPDGTKIAFQSVVNNQSDVFVMNANGTGLVNLTNHPEYDGAPSWSPDGSQLAFVSRRTGGYRVYTMNANGTNVVQRSNQPYSNNPSWSPEGQRIAFDADTDNYSRITPEIWMVNADGSNETLIYKPPGATDTIVSGWSPDGAFISYTRVELILINGTWYWDDAFINAVRWYDTNSHALLSNVPLDWRPHWVTTEIQPPQSAVDPLPPQSGNPVQVSWSGSDNGVAGLKAFDIQVRKGQNGPWTDWLIYTTATSGSYSGVVGGETYYFRSRAWDKAHNFEAWPATPDAVTTIDNNAPVSAVDPLQAYTRKSDQGFLVTWNGYDPGSGIAGYDIQYRLGNGSWVNWFSLTPLLGDYFVNGNIGQTIYFRSRAQDTAQNLESWPGGNGDTRTTLYNWGIRGTVRDNGNAPVTAALVTTGPAALGSSPSDLEGQFSAFVGTQAGSYSATIQKNGYGSLPLTNYPAMLDATVNYILPPADNIVLDSGFESGVLGGPWVSSGGVITAVVAQDEGHTGNSHLQLGSPSPQFTSPFRVDASNSDYDESVPQFILKDNGSIYLFWTEGNGVHYRWRTPDGTWSPEPKVGTNADSQTNAQVLLDAQGRIHLAWIGSNNNIYYARQNTTNGNWTNPIVLNTNTNTLYDKDVQLVVDSSGLPHLIWLSRVGNTSNANYSHMHSYQLQNGSWTTPYAVNETFTGPSVQYSILMDSHDNLHIARGSNNGGAQLHYVRINGQWSTAFLINTPGDNGGRPTLVNDPSGGVKVFWSVYAPATSEGIYSRHWNEETGWWKQQKIGNTQAIGTDISAEVGLDGAIHIAWEDLDDDVNYVYQDPYGHWYPPEVIGSFSAFGTGVDVTADSSGRPHVVWTDDGIGKVQYTYRKWDGSWVTPIELESNASEYFNPNIVFDNENTMHIAYAEYIDRLIYVGRTITDTAETVSVSQVLTIPVNMTSPVLSFMYQLGGAYETSGDSALVVKLDDGTTNTQILDITEGTGPHWTHGWRDISNWSGQTVTLTFTLEQGANMPLAWARIDEVTVGSGYPDVWSSLSDGAGLPGQNVTLALSYGNQGGVTANGVLITQTLPAGLSFVSASQTPISTSPLVWDVGDVASNSGSLTILVTLKIDPAAMPLVYLTSSIDIAPDGPELETENNGSSGQVYTGVSVFMPTVLK